MGKLLIAIYIYYHLVFPSNKLKYVIFFPASLLKLKEEDLSRVPYLQCCMLEAVRLHPVGIITRRVVREFNIKVKIDFLVVVIVFVCFLFVFLFFSCACF